MPTAMPPSVVLMSSKIGQFKSTTTPPRLLRPDARIAYKLEPSQDCLGAVSMSGRRPHLGRQCVTTNGALILPQSADCRCPRIRTILQRCPRPYVMNAPHAEDLVGATSRGRRGQPRVRRNAGTDAHHWNAAFRDGLPPWPSWCRLSKDMDDVSRPATTASPAADRR